MAAARPCAACTKTVFPMDDKFIAEGGAYHRACFKCTECKGQLSLQTFAAIKGVLYCKPHFIKLFKLRGKYDDFDAKPKDADTTEERPQEGAKMVSTTPTKAEPTPVEASSTPSIPSPRSAIKSTDAVASAPAAATGNEVYISGMSVKERIAAMKANPTVTTSVEAKAPKEVSPRRAEVSVVVSAESKPKEEVAPVPVAPVESKPKEETVVVPVESEKATEIVRRASETPAQEVFISGMTVKERIAMGLRAAEKNAETEPKPAVAAEKESVHTKPPVAAFASKPAAKEPVSFIAPAPSEDKTVVRKSARIIPGLGGGGTKCAVCTKTVYPADPSFAADGNTWHRECFKCTHCKGALSLKNMAAINGQLYCKPHFVAIFKLKGSYDSFAKEKEPTLPPPAAEAVTA